MAADPTSGNGLFFATGCTDQSMKDGSCPQMCAGMHTIALPGEMDVLARSEADLDQERPIPPTRLMHSILAPTANGAAFPGVVL